ncbi:TIR domain-containing protein [Nitrosomonas sp.]|uniref:TIR domain-containing protein n=1 Tax=Nitrosomonas sp. TaxID=42353 RepID=UPI0026306A1C|nr:TIR domain-containing protein [Nitrosomonas sp.]
MVHDIFVSYAHNDDLLPEGSTYGWITHFIEELRKVLTQRLGRKPDVWMDHLLLENAQVDATLIEKIRTSQTIILFMSPSYLNSEWCKQEIGDFLTVHSAHKNKESVFIVAVEETEREKWHSRLQALTPLQLYQKSLSGAVHRLGYPNPPIDGEHEYWRQLNELAHLIKLQLALIDNTRGTRSISATPVAEAAQSDKKIKPPVVWIAQPTADLHSQWEALAASIRQRGAQILPVGHSIYPLGDSDFRAVVENDISQADLLIQLLSKEAGDAAKFLQLQALAARMRVTIAEIPFLQWRPENIDLQTVIDSKHRELLQGTIACGFEQFRQQVLEKLDKLMNPVPFKPINKPEQNALTLCITAGQKDFILAEEIVTMVANLKHAAISIPPIPEQDQTIEEYNAYLRLLLANVDGVILAHSQENAMWLQGQHAKVKKMVHKSNPWGAFIDGPPPAKQKILWNDPGLMYLDCRNGLSQEPIQRFIDSLQVRV